MNEVPTPLTETVSAAKPQAGWWRALTPGEKRRVVCFVALFAALVLVFARDLTGLVKLALAKDIHSHTILIPFISGYLLWLRKESLPPPSKGSVVLAITFAGLGVLAWSAPSLLGWAPLSVAAYYCAAVLSFLLFSTALAAGCLGTALIRASTFPIVFLVFMAPMPEGMIDSLENASKLATAEVTDWFFNLAGFTYRRVGNIFQLSSVTLEVAQECSGIRSSFVLLITGILAANMLLLSGWRRWILILLVIPLGVFRNAFRITVLAGLCERYGGHWIHSELHHRGGPIFFAISLIPLFVVIVLLRRSERKPAPKTLIVTPQ